MFYVVVNLSLKSLEDYIIFCAVDGVFRAEKLDWGKILIVAIQKEFLNLI